MAKPNKRHHDLCVAYKNRGQRELNKKEKAVKEQKKIEKIKARTARKLAENGPKEHVSKDPETRGTNRMEPLGDFAYRPKMEHMLPYAKDKSFERRIQNQIDREIMEEKKAERNKKKSE